MAVQEHAIHERPAERSDVLARLVPRALLLLGAAGTLLFVAYRLDERWVPEDDGSFGQSAQRVLYGELPHREFADLYTGGLTFLDAGMFAIFGENLIWLRIPLFICFVAFLVTFYCIARRFASAPVAALAVLLTVGWGLPLYPAAMPSWYLLFFATFGAACILKYLDSGKSRWLILAGAFGGLSLTFKITGIWYVLAVLLFLIFVEQESCPEGSTRRWKPSRLAVAAGGFALFVTLLVASIFGDRLGGPEVFNLFLPVVAVCVAVVVNEVRRSPVGKAKERLARVSRDTFLFLAGVTAPLLIFVAPYIVAGAVPDLVEGVLISPQSRVDRAYLSTPHPALILLAAPLVVMFVARRAVRPAIRRWLDITFACVAVVLLFRAGSDVASYQVIWHWAQSGAPLVPVVGVVTLLFVSRRGDLAGDRRPAMLLLGLAAFASLTQFPFAETIYFCYALPLFVLAALAVTRYANVQRGLFPITLLAVLVVFGFLWLDRSPQTLGRQYVGTKDYVLLDSSRASVRVPASDRELYSNITTLLRAHATGPYIYAGPDTPEIYYLTDFRNPTRSLFDFLDTSGSGRGSKLLRTLEARRVSVIAIDTQPALSDPHEPSVLKALRARYRHGTRVGRIEVRWQ